MANKPELRLTDQQRFDWLRLVRSENVGPRTFRALLTNCGGARAALNALPDLARRGGARRPIRVASNEEIEKELIAARKLGVRFVALGEPDYPPALQEIELRTADSRAPGPRGGAAQGGRRDRGLPQRVCRRTDLRRPACARLGTCRLRYRRRAGARHRSACPSREPGDLRRRSARRRTCKALPERRRAADGADGRIRCDRLRNADRVGAARTRLPASQSHRLRTRLGARSGRGCEGLRLAHHCENSRSSKTVRSSPCPALPSIRAPKEPTIS